MLLWLVIPASSAEAELSFSTPQTLKIWLVANWTQLYVCPVHSYTLDTHFILVLQTNS